MLLTIDPTSNFLGHPRTNSGSKSVPQPLGRFPLETQATLGDQNPIGSLIADVSKVIPGQA